MDKRIKPVELTSRAIKDLQKVKSFNVELHGKAKAQKIIDTIFERLEILENPKHDFSKIGSVDEDFAYLKHEYRKLIEHHCKITYREGKTKIYVVRVFDTRQNPKKNK